MTYCVSRQCPKEMKKDGWKYDIVSIKKDLLCHHSNKSKLSFLESNVLHDYWMHLTKREVDQAFNVILNILIWLYIHIANASGHSLWMSHCTLLRVCAEGQTVNGLWLWSWFLYELSNAVLLQGWNSHSSQWQSACAWSHGETPWL